jgi:DNA-binding CsgD family transcriptional regulator
MVTSCAIVRSVGSSISIVDPGAGRYTKIAERGTACRLGESFPLDEGVTGRVMHSRRPIVLSSYGDVTTGHLPPDSRARNGAVAAIPIWWRGDVIGANVVFAGGPRVFTSEEIDRLEVVTQVVAPGIVTAAVRDLGMTALVQRSDVDGGAAPDGRTGRCVSVEEVAGGLSSLMARAAGCHPGRGGPVQVRVVRDQSVLHLQVREEAEHPAGWRELVEDAEGVVQLVRAEEPGGWPCGPTAPPSPLSIRERQAAVLLSQGFSDRAIAEALLISPKTAEKHVGAVLRKTGTTSRTAAVVRALERGWLADER